MAKDKDADRYPHRVTLPDGASITIRRMIPADRDAVLAFANSLPEEDLLFLRIDITQPEVVDLWVENLKTGFTTSLLAWEGDRVVGYASVHRDPVPWTRRVGELRVNVAPEHRDEGLGRNLINEIFDVARGLGLKKLTVNMTTEQLAARAGFKRIGFRAEAVLSDFIEDAEGRSHDLLIMTYDVEGLTNQVEERLHL